MSFDLIKYEGKAIRMVGTQDKPEWVAADVCDVLGIEMAKSTLRNFPPLYRGRCIVCTPPSTAGQEMLTVTEPGLYRLIAKSRKPEAEKFQEWIFSEVLPSIRRFGCYPPPSVLSDERAVVTLDVDRFTDRLGVQLTQAIDGIGRKFDARCDRIESSLGDHRVILDEVSSRLSKVERRRRLSDATKRKHLTTVHYRYSGKCPCCMDVLIVNSAINKLVSLEFDHWVSPSQPEASKTWAICRNCNELLKDGDIKPTKENKFKAYQDTRREMEQRLQTLLLPGFET